MFKKLALVVAIASCSVYAMDEQRSALMVPTRLGNVGLYHDDHGFKVVREDALVPVQPSCVDRHLRGLSKERLHGLVKAGAYLKLNQMDNEEYTIELKSRTLGAGPGGVAAGVAVGHVGGTVVCHGVYYGVAAVIGAVTKSQETTNVIYGGIQQAMTPITTGVARACGATLGILGAFLPF